MKSMKILLAITLAGVIGILAAVVSPGTVQAYDGYYRDGRGYYHRDHYYHDYGRRNYYNHRNPAVIYAPPPPAVIVVPPPRVHRYYHNRGYYRY